MLIPIILITGCLKKENKYDKEYNAMKEKLIEYGKLVYENYQWLNEETEEGTYFMLLSWLQENNKYDVSMFVNPKTKKPCDFEQTKIEFIYNGINENGEYEYSFNPVIKCD